MTIKTCQWEDPGFTDDEAGLVRCKHCRRLRPAKDVLLRGPLGDYTCSGGRDLRRAAEDAVVDAIIGNDAAGDEWLAIVLEDEWGLPAAMKADPDRAAQWQRGVMEGLVTAAKARFVPDWLRDMVLEMREGLSR